MPSKKLFQLTQVALSCSVDGRLSRMCRSDRGSVWLRLSLRQRWRNAENVKVGCIRGSTYVCVDVCATMTWGSQSVLKQLRFTHQKPWNEQGRGNVGSSVTTSLAWESEAILPLALRPYEIATPVLAFNGLHLLARSALACLACSD